MERTQWDNGVHKLEFEPPDILHVYVNGPVSVNELQVTTSIINDKVVPECGENFYMISHLSPNAGALSPEFRKYNSEHSQHASSGRGLVLVGGSSIARASVNIMMRAMNLLSVNKTPMRMVKTVEDARAIINDWRAKHAGAASH